MCLKSQNHPPTGPWKNCLPWNWSLVPKMLGTAVLMVGCPVDTATILGSPITAGWRGAGTRQEELNGSWPDWAVYTLDGWASPASVREWLTLIHRHCRAWRCCSTALGLQALDTHSSGSQPSPAQSCLFSQACEDGDKTTIARVGIWGLERLNDLTKVTQEVIASNLHLVLDHSIWAQQGWGREKGGKRGDCMSVWVRNVG